MTTLTDTALRRRTFEPPEGWTVIGVHGGKWPNVDLVYQRGPAHRCRIWLTADTRNVASWLWPILQTVERAPVTVEFHVFADRPPRPWPAT